MARLKRLESDGGETTLSLISTVGGGGTSVVTRPILPPRSTNHSAPSGPDTMSWGSLLTFGSWISFVMSPFVVIRPTNHDAESVNQIAPSGPPVIPATPYE